jgi:hypothetical protein
MGVGADSESNLSPNKVKRASIKYEGDSPG